MLLVCSLPHVLRAAAACTFSTSKLPKLLRTRGISNSLTSKRASCTFATAQLPKFHTWGNFSTLIFAPQLRALFNISTSKSAPNLGCFLHFGFKMFFAPQSLSIFDLLSDQMAPHLPLWWAYFSTLQSHKNIFGKHSVSRLFYLFTHFDLLSTGSLSLSVSVSVSFSSLTLLTPVAASVHESEVWFLNFLWLCNWVWCLVWWSLTNLDIKELAETLGSPGWRMTKALWALLIEENACVQKVATQKNNGVNSDFYQWKLEFCCVS